MKKINDRTYMLWTKIFQTLIIVMVVIFLIASVLIVPFWYYAKEHANVPQPATKVSCTYDVTAREKAAYVAGKTAAYQHLLAAQCKKLHATNAEQLQACDKIDSNAVITDQQYGQNDEPQD